MKRCSICFQEKAFSAFSKQTAAKDGLQSRCKECAKSGASQWRVANPDKLKAYNDSHYDPAYHGRRYRAQRGHLLALNDAIRKRNPEKRRAITKAYKTQNAGKVLADVRYRQAAKLRATPPWADRKAIQAIYAEAARLTRETGVKHHVDHVYPLRGPHCCGLHVENNLQILTAVANMAKGNRMPETCLR